MYIEEGDIVRYAGVRVYNSSWLPRTVVAASVAEPRFSFDVTSLNIKSNLAPINQAIAI